jgi:Flp pilus assembly protein TadD
MIRPSVRSAGLAVLLTMNGCGNLVSSGADIRSPGLSVAEAALEGGSGQIALQVSEGVLRKSPTNTQALEIKGDALTLLGDYDQAGAIFQALLAADPNSIRANIGMGRIKLTKDPAAAEARFQLVLRRDPKNLTALNNLGIARDLLGRHAEARTAYRTALAANPELESAQVNMALSLAMSGQGPAAIRLLQAKANVPDAPVKIRHDYAVVLAMAGHRPEAERVLSENMDPDEAHRLLDTVTGTHTPPPRAASSVRLADAEDTIPPDVVQVPEVPAPTPRAGRLAVAPPAAPPVVSPVVSPVAPPPGRAVALAPPPVVVVRPQQREDDADSPAAPPVTPVAAAMTWQRPLALPLRAADLPPQADSAPEVAADPALVTPKVVAMPAARPVPTVAPARMEAAPAARPVAVAAPVRLESAAVVQVARSAPAAAPVPLTSAAITQAARPASAAAPVQLASAAVAQEALPRNVPPVPVSAPVPTPPRAIAPVAAPGTPTAPDAPIVWPDTTPMASPKAPPTAAAATPRPVVAAPAPATPRSAAVSTIAPVAAPPARGQAPVASRSAEPAASAERHDATERAERHDATERAERHDATERAERHDATERAERHDATETAVQFAATASEESARSFWQSLVHRFPAVLGQRTPTVIRFERDGAVFWRVRTEGFDTVTEAQALCARMRAGGQACFVPRS